MDSFLNHELSSQNVLQTSNDRYWFCGFGVPFHLSGQTFLPHFIKYSVHFFPIENYAEILHVHCTWKVAFTNLIHKQSIQVKLLNEGLHHTCLHTILDKIL
jgi:hypothetical protein